MLRVGFTGGIGSGKTTISNIFHSTYNIPIIDADDISRSLLSPNQQAYQQVLNLFGNEALLNNGEINRKWLREKIFLHQDLRKQLENIIHPLVRSEIANQVNLVNTSYCLIVIPLLVESNMQTIVDRILVVDTSRDSQIQRVISRDNVDSDHVEDIIDSQIDPIKRLEMADDVITNNGNIQDLHHQVDQLHQKYLDLSS